MREALKNIKNNEVYGIVTEQLVKPSASGFNFLMQINKDLGEFVQHDCFETMLKF